ncbi:MAG: hypothetical protein NC248_12440 [Bacteroides sp.]|nr:hypothetical protein [Bacteroides sp.]MCM1390769.1 hypothetical protein [Bacteroides sp.]
MTLSFIFSHSASFPDVIFTLVLILILGGIALFVLYWLLVPVIGIVFFAYYTVTGRRKEFLDRMENDPKFLTFDKETGKFIY